MITATNPVDHGNNAFELFINSNWPKGIASDCEKLYKYESDCLERNMTKPCDSCLWYSYLCGLFATRGCRLR